MIARFMSFYNPGVTIEVDGVSEAEADWWCHTLEGHFNGFPLNGIFGDGIVFVAKTYQREEEIALNDARRGFAMCLIFHLLLLTSHFSLKCFWFIPTWE